MATESLDAQDRKSIEEALGEARRRTSTRILVVVASRSGRYERAADLLGLFFGIAAVVLAWNVWGVLHSTRESWNELPSASIGLFPVLASFVFGFILGTMIATRIPGLARRFISKSLLEEEVREKGVELYHRLGSGGAAGSPANVLLYVSLFERAVWVTGSDEVRGKLDSATWAEIKDSVVMGFQNKNFAHALSSAVRRFGALLADPFPPGPQTTGAGGLHIVD